ncbi:MAG: bile acid:sodium symporter family protein, partial [Bacteroidota bacterium]
MNTRSIYKLLLALAGASALVALVLFIIGNPQLAGPFLIAFFVLLAIGFRGYQSLRGFSFTAVIFASVTVAMYYPTNFQEVNGYDLKNLFTPLLQL